MMSRYQAAGVDVNAGYELVKKIKAKVNATKRPGVLGQIGGFGGAFDLSELKKYTHPVLVSGCDGVGTKLMLAQKLGVHDTIGIDCVAMCVNDILAQGAEPLYFLDYIACGKNVPEKLAQVVAGVADGCKQAGCALIGGETAEMPGMYAKDEYDVAGFAVGIAEKSQLLDPSQPQVGDVLLALPSSGLHSNGFSLVRQIIFDDNDCDLTTPLAELNQQTLAQALLEPTKIYANALLPLMGNEAVHGIAHITGGGLVENVPRMLGDGVAAKFDLSKFPELPVLKYLAKLGKLSQVECYSTFNYGAGMILAVAANQVAAIKAILADNNEAVVEVGKLVPRDGDALIFD